MVSRPTAISAQVSSVITNSDPRAARRKASPRNRCSGGAFTIGLAMPVAALTVAKA
jgi:hypothetical protein